MRFDKPSLPVRGNAHCSRERVGGPEQVHFRVTNGLRVSMLCGTLLTGISLPLGCATQKAPVSLERVEVEAPQASTPWWDFIGWLVYPTALANSEGELR